MLAKEIAAADEAQDRAAGVGLRYRLADLKETKLLDHEGALTLYEEKLKEAHHLKPTAKLYREKTIKALLKNWPELKNTDPTAMRIVNWMSESGMHSSQSRAATNHRRSVARAVVSPTSMPSFNNSPWMRGAPHSGFSRLIRRINSRTSCGTAGRPGRP